MLTTQKCLPIAETYFCYYYLCNNINWDSFAVQQEYSSISVGMTMGIIAGVIAPLLILFGCIAYHIFMRKQQDKAEIYNNPSPR